MSDFTERLGGAKGALAFKAPCRVATTANITLSGLQTIDGVSVVADDRVLVKNQTTATANGIYKVSSGNWTRAKDFDGNDDIVKGTRVYVHSGSTQAATYVVSSSDPITIGTSSISFVTETSLFGAGVEFFMHGGSAVLTTGLKGYIEVPFSGTITQAGLFANQSGNMVVNIWKTTTALFDATTHPVAADTICGSTPPTLSSAAKVTDSTLTGWTTSVSQGDILAFNIDSTNSLITFVTCTIRIQRIQ